MGRYYYSIFNDIISGQTTFKTKREQNVSNFLMPYVSVKQALFSQQQRLYNADCRTSRSKLDYLFEMPQFYEDPSSFINTQRIYQGIKSSYYSYRKEVRLKCLIKLKNSYATDTGKSINDDYDESFVKYLYRQLPKTAFTDNVLKLWVSIYNTAHYVNGTIAIKPNYVFRYHMKTNHGMVEEYRQYSFISFVKCIPSDASSNDRFFAAYYAKMFSEDKDERKKIQKKVDTLLRFYSFRECFADGDIKYLKKQGIEIDDFFNTIEIIKNSSSK